MSLAQQEFTNAGRAMLGRAQNGEILHISKIVVGDGAAAQASDLWPLTALIDKKLDVVISLKNDYGNGTLLIEGSFLSKDVAAPFYLKECGVMAHIGAEADQLYSVSNVYTDVPDYIDPAAPTVQVFKIKLVIDRIPAANLIIQIGPSENVVGANIGANTVGPGWFHDAAGNVLSFKRIVEGSGMDIHDSTDGNSVYVGISTLQNNLDIYVPLTYPGITDPAVLFPTVQAAHDYLLGFVIPPDKFATIHVAAGTFTYGEIRFIHPNSKQISLLGWQRQDVFPSKVEYVDATHRKVTCNAGNISVGQTVYLTGCVQPWRGGCTVTSKDTLGQTWVVVDLPKRSSTAPYTSADTSSTIRLSWYPTVLNCNAPAPNGNLILYRGIALVSNLTLIGGNTAIRFVDERCNCSNIMAKSCPFGLIVHGSRLFIDGETVVTDCGLGIGGDSVFWAGIGNGDVTLINGCGTGVETGQQSLLGGVSGSTAAVWINHSQTGIWASGGQNLIVSDIHYSYNDIGMAAQYSGSINASGSLPLGNTLDLWAQGMGYIEYTRNGFAAPTCNPVAEALGNQNSLIHVLP